MSREKFMNELEYLLQDIQEEDKADALQYYRDYLEEAGPDKEEEVIRGFGSPARIAAMIRADIAGSFSSGGEFTESGYRDERFQDPGYKIQKYKKSPDPVFSDQNNSKKQSGNSSTGSSIWKILGIILLLLAASPVIFGVGGTLLAIVITFVVVAGCFAFVPAFITIILLIVGVSTFFVGLAALVYNPLSGFLSIGISGLITGFGILGLVISGFFYGKVIPGLFRWVINLFRKGIYRRRKKNEKDV